MLDRRREDLTRLVQLPAGIEHVVDLVLRPFLDLIEVVVVRDDWIGGLFGGLAIAVGSYFAGRRRMLIFLTPRFQ